jgi:hypothetical protein
LALAVPGLVLTFHMLLATIMRQEAENGSGTALGGGLTLALIVQLWLLAVSVLISQSLLVRATRYTGVLSVCGAAIMLGAAAALMWGPGECVEALGLLGFAGLAVWLTPLWGGGGGLVGSLHNRLARTGCLLVAAGGAAALAAASPLAAMTALSVLGVIAVTAGIAFARARLATLALGVACLATGIAALWHWSDVWTLHELPITWLGEGGRGLAIVSASDSGLVVLAMTSGWAGVIGLAGGLTAMILVMLCRARRGRRGDRARAIGWSAAAAVVLAALLAPGGWFIPASLLGAGFLWGLLPSMLGRRDSRRSGGWVLLATTLVMLMLALVQNGAPAGRLLAGLGGDDGSMHAVVAMLLALLLAWLIGSNRWYLGVLAIILAFAAGGAAEVIQGVFANRSMEMSDWIADGVGCAAALPIYLLCMLSRWCESSDAPVRRRVPVAAA